MPVLVTLHGLIWVNRRKVETNGLARSTPNATKETRQSEVRKNYWEHAGGEHQLLKTIGCIKK